MQQFRILQVGGGARQRAAPVVRAADDEQRVVHQVLAAGLPIAARAKADRDVDAVAEQLHQALAADPASLRSMAGELAKRYRRTFAAHLPPCNRR